MLRPRVVVHNLVSADGRLDGVPADLALYYELAARFPQQAVLSGSGTITSAAADAGVDLTAADASPRGVRRRVDDRPWLVIVDSRGRVTRFEWLRAAGHWRDVLVLCAAATPRAHLERLRSQGVAYQQVGRDRVDLAAALEVLAERYAVRALRVDGGPALNGALLRAGLVDEISLLLAPYVLGVAGAAQHLLDDSLDARPRRLELTGVQRLRDGHLWLRYRVEAES